MNPDKPTTGSRIPNLYELLNLNAREDDNQRIKAALKEFADRVKQIKEPDSAKHAAKLFAIAKQNLLDPVRKAAYDSLWEKVYGDKLTVLTGELTPHVLKAEPDRSASPVDVKEWDYSELSTILPQADAAAPLDMAAFLESTDSLDGQRSTEDLDRDFQRLLLLLGGEVAAPVPAAKSPSSSSSTVTATPFDFSGSPSHSFSASSIPVATPIAVSDFSTEREMIPPVVIQPSSNSTRALVKARKKRDRSLLLTIGGGLTVLLMVLGVLVVMLNRNMDSKGPERVLASAGVKANPATEKGDVTNELVTKRSGLPQPGSGLPQPGSGLPQPGGNPNVVQSQLANSDTGMSEPAAMEPAMSSSSSPNSPVTTVEPAATPTPTLSSIPSTEPSPVTVPPSPPMTSDTPASSSTTATSATATSTNSPTVSPPTSEPEEVVILTVQEKNEWKKLLRSVRLSLGNRDFEKADKSLEKASGLAKSSQQKAQLARVNTIRPLVEKFHDSLKAAVSEMNGGEVITLGTQEISFVEATEQLLIIKVSGRPKRYSWDELPVLVAFGLADLKLDQSPNSAAAKAAFAAVHGKINSIAKEDARKLMQTAAAANVLPSDTHEIFDDDYSLD